VGTSGEWKLSAEIGGGLIAKDKPRPALEPVKLPRAPAGLSSEARRMWRSIVGGWVLDVPALGVLEGALRSWDLFKAASKELEEDGPTVVNPATGLKRSHPAAKVAKDSFAAYRAALAQLALDPDAAP